jgi:hypothetical protein
MDHELLLRSLPAVAGVLVGAAIVLFFALFHRYRADAALVIANPSDKRVSLLGVLAIFVAAFAPMPFKVIAMGVGFPLFAWQGWMQQGALRQAGASPAFLWRLNAVSAVAALGLAMAAVVLLIE